jgi:hypothetical protein
MILMAIDPGSSSGAFAVWAGDDVVAYNMPATLLDIWTFISKVGATRVVMENVGGSRPGNSARSSRTFAEHVGALKMALLAAGIPHEFVMPRKWLTGLFGESYPKGATSAEVSARKQFTYERMQREYPTTKFTKKQADAVAIMHWALTRGRGQK